MTTKITPFIILFFSFIGIAQTRYVDAVFENVTFKTLNYAVKSKDTLKMDVYEPENDTIINRAVFIMVHAGGFDSGERNNSSLVSLAENVAKKGFVVVSIDYRLLKNKNFNCSFPVRSKLKVFSHAAEDLLSALQYLINYKTSFGIDETKIILFGASAGGETALNVVYNRDFFIKNSQKYNDIKPAAVISISGAVLKSDLITKENSIPTILYHGINDKVVPYNTSAHQSCLPTSKGFLLLCGSETIAEKIEKTNTSFLFYSYQNKGHNIFNLPNDDFYQAFLFLNKVVFNKKFFQARITQ